MARLPLLSSMGGRAATSAPQPKADVTCCSKAPKSLPGAGPTAMAALAYDTTATLWCSHQRTPVCHRPSHHLASAAAFGNKLSHAL